MILTTSDKPPIESSGEMARSTFTIKASAKSFRLIADSLYSNKIGSLMREVTANAVDANIEAGKPNEPVEIHLPNAFEPWFSVKDNGTGLPHEFMMKRYTALFDSTKNESNDFTGGFGVGRLSAFAYADSYMVTSRHNGMKRVYTVFIADDDMPSVSMMSEEPTDEPNGFEVNLAVKPADFYSFESNARQFFSRVNPMPIFKGNANFAPNGITYLGMSGDGWKTRAGGGSAFAVMGIVGYPLDPERSGFTSLQQSLLNLPLDIAFKIGDIEVAMSREKLSFNNRSLDVIKARLDKIAADIKDVVTAKFDACQDLWEARCLLWTLKQGELNMFRPVIDSLSLEWKGQKITLGHIRLNTVMGNTVPVAGCVNFFTNYKGTLKRNHSYEIPVAPNVTIYINDLKTGAISRARFLLTAQGGPKVVDNIWMITLKEGETQDAVLTLFGMSKPLPLMSSLPKPPKTAYSLTEKGKAQALLLNVDDIESYMAADAWEVDENFDFEEGGVYVPMERYGMFGLKPREYYRQKLDNLTALDVDISAFDIYGLKHKLAAKAATHPKWKRLDNYIQEQIVAKLKCPKLAVKLASYEEHINHQDAHFIKGLLSIAPKGEYEILDKYLAQLDILKNEIKDIKSPGAWMAAATDYGVPLAKTKPVVELAGLRDQILELCPILNALDWAAREDYSVRENIWKRFKNEILGCLQSHLTMANF